MITDKKNELYKKDPTAIVDIGSSIGQGTTIWHFSHICAGAKIGEFCSLGQNVFVANNVVIGNNVKIQNNVSVYDAVVLEDDVFCGPSMVFTNVYNPRSHVSRKHEYRITHVCKGATIGANATVICGITIGHYAFIGAGSVVRNNVKPYAVMVGVPARQIGWICQCGVRLFADTSVSGLDNNTEVNTEEYCEVNCVECSRRYTITAGQCDIIK